MLILHKIVDIAHGNVYVKMLVFDTGGVNTWARQLNTYSIVPRVYVKKLTRLKVQWIVHQQTIWYPCLEHQH